MGLYLKSADGVAPSDFSIDFNTVHDAPGPFWVSMEYWTDTADAGAGSFIADINWTDPSGNAQAFNGSGIDLTTAGSRNQFTQVFSVSRQSGSSLWTFDGDLIGAAGTSLISYRIMTFPTQTQIFW